MSPTPYWRVTVTSLYIFLCRDPHQISAASSLISLIWSWRSQWKAPQLSLFETVNVKSVHRIHERLKAWELLIKEIIADVTQAENMRKEKVHLVPYVVKHICMLLPLFRFSELIYHLICVIIITVFWSAGWHLHILCFARSNQRHSVCSHIKQRKRSHWRGWSQRLFGTFGWEMA